MSKETVELHEIPLLGESTKFRRLLSRPAYKHGYCKVATLPADSNLSLQQGDSPQDISPLVVTKPRQGMNLRFDEWIPGRFSAQYAREISSAHTYAQGLRGQSAIYLSGSHSRADGRSYAIEWLVISSWVTCQWSGFMESQRRLFSSGAHD